MGKNLQQSDQNALKCVIHVSRTVDNHIIAFTPDTWKIVYAAAAKHGRLTQLAEGMIGLPTSCFGFHFECYKTFITKEWMDIVCRYMSSSSISHNPDERRVFQPGLPVNTRPQSFVPRQNNLVFEQNNRMVANLHPGRPSYGAGPSQLPQQNDLTQLSATEIDNILRPQDSHYSRSEAGNGNSLNIDLIRKHLAMLPPSIVQNGNIPTMNSNNQHGNNDVSNIQNIPPIQRYMGNDGKGSDSRLDNSRSTAISRVNEFTRHSEVTQHQSSCHVLSAATPRPFINPSMRQPATTVVFSNQHVNRHTNGNNAFSAVTSLVPTVGSTNQSNSLSLRTHQQLPRSNNNSQLTNEPSNGTTSASNPNLINIQQQSTSIVTNIHPRNRINLHATQYIRPIPISREQVRINDNPGIPAASNWRDHRNVGNAVSMNNPVGQTGAVLNNDLMNNSSRSMPAVLPDIITETSRMRLNVTNSQVRSSTHVTNSGLMSSFSTSVNPPENTVHSLNRNCRISRVMSSTVTPVEQIAATNTASRNDHSTPISSTINTFTSPTSIQRDNLTNTCNDTSTIVQSVSSLKALLDHQTLVISSIQNINNRGGIRTTPATEDSNLRTGNQSTVRINDASLGDDFVQSLFLDVDVEKWISPYLTPKQRDLFFNNDTSITDKSTVQDNVNTKGLPRAVKMRRFLNNLRERIRKEFVNVRRKVLDYAPDGTFADLEHAEKPLYEYISSKIDSIKNILNTLSAEETANRPVTSSVTINTETINTNSPTTSICPDKSANEVVETSSINVSVVHSSCIISSAIVITVANTPPKVIVSPPSAKSTTVTSSVKVSVAQSPTTLSSIIGISATNTRPEETISSPSEESVQKNPDKENLIVKLPFSCKVGKKGDSSRHSRKSLDVPNERKKGIESNENMTLVEKTAVVEDVDWTVVHSDENYIFVLKNGKVQVIPKSDTNMEKDESELSSEIAAVEFNPQNTYSLNEYETAVAQDDLDHLRTMLNDDDDQRPSTCDSPVETESCNNLDFYCNLEMPPLEVVDFCKESSEILPVEEHRAEEILVTSSSGSTSTLPSLSDRIKARDRTKNEIQGKVVKIPLNKITLNSNLSRETFVGTKRKRSPNRINENNRHMDVNKKQKLLAERKAIRKKKRQFRDKKSPEETQYIRIFAGKAAVELERRDILKLDLHPRVVVEDYFNSSNYSISFSSNYNMSNNNSSRHSDTDISSDEETETDTDRVSENENNISESQPIVNKQKLERLRRICNSRSSLPDR